MSLAIYTASERDRRGNCPSCAGFVRVAVVTDSDTRCHCCIRDISLCTWRWSKTIKLCKDVLLLIRGQLHGGPGAGQHISTMDVATLGPGADIVSFGLYSAISGWHQDPVWGDTQSRRGLGSVEYKEGSEYCFGWIYLRVRSGLI